MGCVLEIFAVFNIWRGYIGLSELKGENESDDELKILAGRVTLSAATYLTIAPS